MLLAALSSIRSSGPFFSLVINVRKAFSSLFGGPQGGSRPSRADQAAADANSVVAIAKQAGYVISSEEVRAQAELSEGELEGVAGGTGIFFSWVCGPGGR